MYFIKYILIIQLVSISLLSLSQEAPRIILKGSYTEDTIKLRWAASSASLWKQMNKLGVRVERHTLVRKGEVLPKREIKEISPNLKAKPLPDWESIVQENEYAAIIAQALYGDDFQLSGGKDLSTIVAISEDLEQRFAISLYAADQSFDAARMAGWGIVDNEINVDERYLYKISSPIEGIEDGVFFIALDEPEKLPQPYGLSGIWGDKSVMLVWDYGMLRNYYNSYYIERSVDGGVFKRLEGIPITNFNNKETVNSQRMYYVDSLQSNTKEYSYRLVGINAFGEQSPPSDTLTGTGKSLLRYTPNIIRSEINLQGELELEWEFQAKGNSLITGFVINRSDQSDKGFIPVIEDVLPSTRIVIYNKLQESNYFTITAIAKEGASTTSFPVLVQPIDSIPPLIPKGLKGEIDSMGVVSLYWNPNKDTDLLGYKVFRAQAKNEELIQLIDLVHKDTVYKDTINLHNLNSKVYYAIAALDKRYNQSDLGEVLTLEKPDLIKPIPPLITGYQIEMEGIRINWINSPDSLVKYHRIYRKIKDKHYEEEVLLKTITNFEETSYLDTAINRNVRYVYTLRSLKKNYLESDASNSITLFSNKAKGQIRQIDQFNAIVDKTNRLLKLEWKDELSEVNSYEVYKSVGEEKPQLWKVLASDIKEVPDKNLTVSVRYTYYIRALLKDGAYSKMKEIEITY